MSARLGAAIVILLVAAGSFGLYLYLKPEPLPDHVLYGNGHVEATEIRIAAEIAGRVVESRFAEGEQVTAGDLLVQVDETDRPAAGTGADQARTAGLAASPRHCEKRPRTL